MVSGSGSQAAEKQIDRAFLGSALRELVW